MALCAAITAAVAAGAGWLIDLLGDNEDEILGVRVLTMALASVKKSYYDWALLTSAGG